MQIGKIQENVLKRSVLKPLHSSRPEVCFRPGPGMGYTAVKGNDGETMVVTTNVVEGTPFQVSVLTVPRALNSLICSGARPVGIMLGVMLPQWVSEAQLKDMMTGIDAAAQAHGVDVLGGHTQVSDSVSSVIVTVTALGFLPENDESRGGESLKLAGQDIVMTKWAGLSGSWLLEQKYHNEFTAKYNQDLSESISGMSRWFSVIGEARVALEYGASVLYDLSEGGVFGALWEMAVLGKAGFYVDLKRIPLKQETVELCDFIDTNPYQLVSMGSLLIAAHHGEHLVRELTAAGISAAMIGTFTNQNDRIVINDEEVRYLEPPRAPKII